MARKKEWRKKVKKQEAILERRSLAFLLILISSLLLFSLFGPKNRSELAKQHLSLGENFESHLVLAEEFLQANDLAGAERELLAASRLVETATFSSPNEQTNILGVAASRLEELWRQKRARDPEDIRVEIKHWEGILAERPNYRDALLRLALYHYQLGNLPEAKDYLGQALGLDPSFEPARELERFLR